MDGFVRFAVMHMSYTLSLHDTILTEFSGMGDDPSSSTVFRVGSSRLREDMPGAGREGQVLWVSLPRSLRPLPDECSLV